MTAPLLPSATPWRRIVLWLALPVLGWVAFVSLFNAILPLMEDWEKRFLPDFQKILAHEVGLDSAWIGRKLQITYTGQVELVLINPVLIADRSLPTRLAQLSNGGHPWWLAMDELHVAVHPLALWLGKGDGSIRDITLKRPVLHMTGAEGQHALENYIQWLVKKYKKPKASQVDWMYRSLIRLENYTIVSPQWTLPALLPHWQGPVRLWGKTVEVRLRRKQRIEANGDLRVEGATTRPLASPRWKALGRMALHDLNLLTADVTRLSQAAKSHPNQPQPWLDSLKSLDVELQNWQLAPLMQVLGSRMPQRWRSLLNQQQPSTTLHLKITPPHKTWLSGDRARRQILLGLATRSVKGMSPASRWPDLTLSASAMASPSLDVLEQINGKLLANREQLDWSGQLSRLNTRSPQGTLQLSAVNWQLHHWHWLAPILPPTVSPWVHTAEGQLFLRDVVIQPQADRLWLPVRGEVALQNVQIATDAGPDRSSSVQDGQLKVEFLPRRWHVRQLSGRLAQGSVAASLMGGYWPRAPLRGTISLSRLPLDRLLALARQLPNRQASLQQTLSQVSAQGEASATIRLDGTLQQPNPQGMAMFDQAALIRRDTGEVLTRWQGRLQITPDTLASEHLALSIGQSPVNLAFALPLQRNRSGWLSLQANRVPLATLRQVAQTWTSLLNQPVNWQAIPAVTGVMSLHVKSLINGSTLRPYGQVTLRDVATTIALPSQPLPIQQGNLDLLLNNQLVTLTSGQATVGRLGLLKAQGSYALDRRFYQLKAQAERLDLAAVTPFLPASVTQAPRFGLRQLEGHGNLSLALSGQGSRPPVISQLDAMIPQGRAVLSGLPESLTVAPLIAHYSPASGHVEILQGQGSLGPAPFRLTGWVDGQFKTPKPDYRLTVAIDHLPVESLRSHKAFWQALVPGLEADIYNTSGSISALANLSPQSNEGTVTFEDAGIYIARTPMPVHHVSGTINWRDKGLLTSLPQPLKMGLGNGEFTLQDLRLTGAPDWRVAAQGEGRLTEIELNNLIGNPTYFQPTEYPVQTSVAVNLSGHWQPGKPQNNQLVLRTGAVLHVKDSPVSTVVPASQSGTPALDAKAAPTPTRLKNPKELPPAQLPQPEEPAENPTPGYLATETNPVTQTGQVTQDSTQTGNLAEEKTPEPVAPKAPPSPLTEDELLKQALKTLQAKAQEGYHSLLTLAAIARLDGSLFTLSEGQLRLLGHHEPVRMTLTGTLPSSPARPWQPVGRIWMDRPLHLPDLNEESWNNSYQFESGDVSMDILIGQAPQVKTKTGREAVSDTLLSTASPVAQANPAVTTPPPTIPEPVSSVKTPAPTSLTLPLTGQIVLKDLVAPNLLLERLNATVALDGQQARLSLSPLQTLSTEMAFTGVINQLAVYPWVITQGELTGPSFYVDGFQRFISSLTRKGLGPVLDGRPASRRWLAADPVKLPIYIKQANASFKEAIVDNILLKDVTSQLSLFSNGYLEMDNLQLTAAGGQATGRLFMNPSQDNLLSLTLDSQQVEANALSQVLLNATNEIFGSLSGRIQFTTFGESNQAMIQNANGMASFKIDNGRLPTIAKVETLLTAANIVRGGILGLNLNNLLRTLKPFDTNYAALLDGDFQIANGIIYTSNLVSNGRNLDLLVKGGIRLDNGVGNLMVVGNMSQDVDGTLGKLGQLSLRKLFRFIPVLGYIPGKKNKNKTGLINYVPGFGFVPGLGGVAQDVNSFSVRMEGPLEDPSSIKDLQWLD